MRSFASVRRHRNGRQVKLVYVRLVATQRPGAFCPARLAICPIQTHFKHKVVVQYFETQLT
jgi:hypothetical protein